MPMFTPVPLTPAVYSGFRSYCTAKSPGASASIGGELSTVQSGLATCVLGLYCAFPSTLICGFARKSFIGVMLFAVDEVRVDFRVEGSTYLPGVAGEFDGRLAFGDASDGETLQLQPCIYGRDIRVRRAVELAELLRGEPFVIAGAAKCVSILKKLAKC